MNDRQMTLQDREDYKIKWSKYSSILKNKDISANAKVVLYSLLKRLMGKYYCFPSQGQIAKDTGLTIDKVKASMKQLKTLISVEVKRKNPVNGRPMHCNVYDLSNFVEKVAIRKSKKS